MRLCSIALLLLVTVNACADETDDLLAQAQSLLNQGQYHLATDKLRLAEHKTVATKKRSEFDGLLGLSYYQMHRYEQADALLNIALASKQGAPTHQARWAAALADSAAQRGQKYHALQLYEQALRLAGADLKLRLSIGLEQLSLQTPEQQLNGLQSIQQQLKGLQPASEQMDFLVAIAIKAAALGQAGQALAYHNFNQVKTSAKQQPLLLAQSLLGLAKLYESQQRFSEALQLNSEALAALQGLPSSDMLVNLWWQQGRLHRALQQNANALIAYQHAIEQLEPIRQDIPVEYHNGRSSFRDTLEPIYLGLADLLLQQAHQQTGTEKINTLRRARETVELIKQSEVEDFLGGRCGVHSDKGTLLEAVAAKTAIIYPILLSDRLELLVSIGNTIQQYTQAVGAKDLNKLVQDMIKNVRRGNNGKAQGQRLYEQLIAPLEPWLQSQQVQTLVMIPDSTLRLLPLAALYDGKQYLVERYALASSPGLTLIKPEPLEHQKLNALLSGLSKPGDVIQHLPPAFLRAVASAKGREVPHQYNGKVTDYSEVTRSVPLEQLLRQPEFQQHLQDSLSLPAVAQEIANLRQQIPNTALMNEQFTLEQFQHELTNQPYGVVHIASHGIFGKTAAASFVMAYDNIIDMNVLETLFNTERFERQPIELLTLNACETAQGDDRAPLGLSGVAIKTNVKSALGTLWSVNDEASYRIMSAFYQGLGQQKMTKVNALQQAQLALLHNPNFQAPLFWSPFILVGNWL